MIGLVASVNGERMVRLELCENISDPEGLGLRLAEALLEEGGREILSEVYGHTLE
jgi:hydroxymethylbilane synthase